MRSANRKEKILQKNQKIIKLCKRPLPGSKTARPRENHEHLPRYYSSALERVSKHFITFGVRLKHVS